MATCISYHHDFLLFIVGRISVPKAMPLIDRGMLLEGEWWEERGLSVADSKCVRTGEGRNKTRSIFLSAGVRTRTKE